jgi:uncharacterized membrane protein
MPFTVMVCGLALALGLAGRFVLPDLYGGFRQRARTFVLSAWSWLWGEGWRGALTFAFAALALGTLIVVNSWDFPTFVGVVAAGVLISLLLSRRSATTTLAAAPLGRSDGYAQEPERPLGTRGGISLALASAASVGAVALLGLLAYIPFFLNFKAFFTQINLLIDGEPINGTGAVMRRTTLPEFTLVWAIFLFITLSYLVYRLWRFPWADAIDSLIGQEPSPSTRRGPAIEPGAAFARFRPSRRVLSPALVGTGSSGGVVQLSSGDPLGNAGATGTANQEPQPVASDLTEDGSHVEILAAPGGADANTPYFPEIEMPTTDGDEALREWDGAQSGLAPQIKIEPEPAGWLADAHEVVNEQAELSPTFEQPGVIPLWAGLLLLTFTAGFALLQAFLGQPVVALLVAIIGGLVTTLLSTTRSAPALFAGVLLVAGWLVALGVELVWLGDHLSGSDMFRMNTVFKFYIQVWVLVALGGALAVYYIVHGLPDLGTESSEREHLREDASAGVTPVSASLPAPDATSPNGHEHFSAPGLADDATPEPPPADNWLVWSADELGEMADPEYRPDLEPMPEPSWATLAQVAEEPLPDAVTVESGATTTLQPDTPMEDQARPIAANQRRGLLGVRWTVPRIAWVTVFSLFLLASFAFPIWGTPSRIKERFPISPPIGTLDGRAYMSTGVYVTDQSPYPVVLKYDLEGIRWLNANVPGLATIVELPAEYYRAGGMRVASNTGLPMVIGGLHQDEQRWGVYSRLVGDRQRDVNDLLTTTDVQKALIILSKYDVDYIYLGQLEQAKAGVAGMAKFAQMAQPDIGLLREVFRADAPEGTVGTIIYRVVREDNKDPRLVVGAPVESSGIPGISITPLPTPTPVPPPTPPVGDPVLSGLMAAVAANPTDRDARVALMEWFRDNGYPLEAAAQLEELIKLDPTSVNLRHMLGDMYQAGGQPDKALAAWEGARDIAPDNPDAHNKVGIAYMERRRYDDAIREFEAAVKVNPGFTESWFHLGEVHEMNGDVEGAKRAYQAAVDNAREPNGWSDSARNRLAQMP